MRRPLGPNWLIEWSNGGFSRKSVVLIDRVTGRRSEGHHWSSWDRALRMAIDNSGVTMLAPKRTEPGADA
ncbi:MAG: hypothetical protein KY394_03640 [Actinobacteria bacterium]|nr:hypothetical protein [Actinomycetota bacterium]